MDTLTRPVLGQVIHAYDRLVRTTNRKPKGEGYARPQFKKEWVIQGGRYPFSKAEPIKGIYVGYRTYCDGWLIWNSDEGYSYDPDPDRYQEVWLVVPHPRQNPVPVRPEDVHTWEEK